jgi:transitional endoplasmic reticulum ATPase
MPPKGILLSGPSGVGKTTLATMLGQSISMSFFPTKGIDFITKEIGESEQRIHSLFEKARSSAPSLILFDDIDSIAPKRGFTGSFSDRLLTTLLVEMDGMVGKDGGVIVMATTSRLFSLDPAITRPGRFDFIIEIPLPNEDERRNLFTSFCQNIPIENMNEVREFVVKATNGKSGADIEGIIRESAMVALRESIQTKSITISHFEKVIGKGIQSSMNKQLNVFAKPKFRRK